MNAGRREAGPGTLNWDRTDEHGRSVGAGVYVVRLTAGSVTAQDKVIVLE